LELGFVLLVGALTASAITSANHQSLSLRSNWVLSSVLPSSSLFTFAAAKAQPPKRIKSTNSAVLLDVTGRGMNLRNTNLPNYA
jgi:hypothetical protein